MIARLSFFLVSILSAASAVFAATEDGSMKIRARLKEGEWKEYPTRVLTDLKDFHPKPVKLDSYGGWADAPKQAATGFFRTQKIGDRWWLVTPAGHLYLNIAVNSTSPGRVRESAGVLGLGKSSPATEKAFKDRYGSVEKWWNDTVALLKKTGFNGTGSWSADLANRRAKQRLAYTPNWGFMSNYGTKRGGTVQLPGHTGYPNDCIFVFDPGFEAFCDEHAKKLAETRDDPWLLGHFSDNEMPFPSDLLDNALKLPEADPTNIEARRWIAARAKAAATLTVEDREAWRGYVADRYYGIVSRAIRKYDPNHLYLGSRFYGSERRSQAVFAAAGKYLDVVSVNVYQVWTPSDEVIGRWTDWSGRPVLVTEWYAKGEDSGMANTTGAGWTVGTQAERGWFYQHFTLALLQTRNCIGWHWFKYMDNDPTDPKPEPSNQDSNKGIVTAEFKPHQPLIDRMDQLNEVVYPLTQYFDRLRK